jgi:hypothetical protein
MFVAFGAASLLVAVGLFVVLLRLRRTLGVLEESLDLANDELRDTLPELRETIGNVNDITSGVNVALKLGAAAAVRISEQAAATARSAAKDAAAVAYGIKVAGREMADGPAPRPRGGARSGKRG